MRIIFSILFFTIWQSSSAQTVIAGRITDLNNKPLSGASINLKDTYDGATSDSLGYYYFSTDEEGKQILEASLLGFSSYTSEILIKGDTVETNISLKELITELKAVVLTAGTFEAGDQKKGAVLSAIDIVTTAGANGSVTGALNTLPGTQQVGESTGLFVRGGTAAESKIYFDGSLVNNFYYSSVPGMASRGRFNPFLFKGTIFSTGGYSALYGQALSSALILESTDLPEKTEGNFSASVIGIGGGIQKLAKNKKSSWGATYYYTNLGLAFKAIKQENDYFQVPKNNTFDANFRIKTKKGFIKYYGYASFDKVGFSAKDIDSLALKNAFTLKNGNTYHNLNWKEFLGKGWKMQLALSYSYNQDKIHNELQDENDKIQIINSPEIFAFKNYDILSKTNFAEGRFILEKKGKSLNAFRFGADEFYTNEKTVYTGADSSSYLKNISDYLTAVFVEKDFYLTNDLAIKIGMRAEHSEILKKWNLAERLSLAYKFKDNSQASFAFGTFYQNPEFKYLPGYDDLGFSKATHYILQYQKFTSKRTFRTELFYKKYDKLYKTATGFSGNLAALNNSGFGYARGIELFWRDKSSIKNLDYWISYSFLDTKRNYLNFPFEMQPSFAAKHTVSLVMKKFVLPWRTGFNASYTYASGRPYYNLYYSQAQNEFKINDIGKTKDYNSLNFSLNYLPNLGKKDAKTFGIWVLSVSNVLGNNNIYGYNYSANSENKVAIIPPSKRFVYIGYFLSFGIDRTEDAINNNL